MPIRKIFLASAIQLFALQVLADPPGAPGYGGSSSSSSGSRSGGTTSSSSSGSRSGNTGNNPGNNNAPGYNGGSSSSSSGTRSGGTTSNSSSGSRSGNTGNNPGNNNAPGYNGGSSSSSGNRSGGTTSSSSSGNRSANTGNNPGNNNAPGYNGGGSSSSSGNRSGGTTSSSNSSSRPTNTGNNPGNPNAPGYNGSTSTTSTGSSTRSIGQQIADRARNSALGRVASVAANAVSSVVSGAANITRTALEPQYNAINAGLANQRASIRGTIGLGTIGAETVMDRAYYRGVSDYYNANNIPANRRAVPQGPVEALISARAAPNTITPEWERVLARQMDTVYRDQAALVTVPGQITPANARQYFGPVWDQMNSTQQYGVMNSVTVVGNNVAPDVAGYNTRATTYAPGGIVAVNTDHLTGDYGTNMLHETQHAGDQATYANASRDVSNLSGRDRALAIEARDAAQVAGGNRSDGAYRVDPADVAAAQAEMGAGYYPSYSDSYVENVATDVENPEALYNDNYHSLTTEMRAFMNESTDQADLVQGIMDDYNSQRDVRQGRVAPMTPAESRAIVDMFRESAALQQIDRTINDYTSRRLNE